jgi:peptide deformylase
MAVRKIIRMGHPTLRQVAREVTEQEIGSDPLQRLIEDMVDTLHDYGGIGLAAPQINEPLRLAIIEIPAGPSRYGDLAELGLSVFVNPDIQIIDPARAGYWEGCLSVPGLRGFVERPQHIKVTASNQHGEPVELELSGFSATVFQHEFDHLDGKLYLDRMTDTTKLAFEEEFARFLIEPHDDD